MNTEITSSSFSQSVEGVEYAHAQAEASSKTEINETNRMTFLDFPEDLILSIFSMFSTQTLAKLSLVCKSFKICADHDIVWRCLAETVFIPAEIQAKPPELLIKEFYKSGALPQIVGRQEGLNSEFSDRDPDFRLAPRDPVFIQRFKQMQLENYKLLDIAETKELLAKPDTQALLKELALTYNESILKYYALPIQHVIKTQVGDIKFDIINCTNYLISFNAERHMLINNKLTDIHFSAVDCQLLVYISKDNKFWVKNRDLGHPRIFVPRCKMKNILEMDKVDKIMGWKE